MTDEQEEGHYQGYGHDPSTCHDCRIDRKWELARPLADAVRAITLDGVHSVTLASLVTAIDSILDEWPR